MGPIRCSVTAAVFLWSIRSFADPSLQSFPDLYGSQYSLCPKNEPPTTHISAIDVSHQVDEAFVDQAKAQHVQVIFRYYDWKSDPDDSINSNDKRPYNKNVKCSHSWTKFNEKFDVPWKSGETLKDKTLSSRERNLILSKGLAIGTVFQHCNDLIETFKDSKRAAFDAERALQLAKDLHQPPKTVIFFGVDLDVRNKEDLAPIQSYMDVVKQKIEDADYILGIYGNGFTCKSFPKTYCWLSQSSSYKDSEQYANDRKWDILQCFQRFPFPPGQGPTFDLDIFNNGTKPPIPFWTAARPK